MTETGHGKDSGFALVAAIGAMLLFALFAYAMLAADRGAIADVDAQIRRAKLEAAADAGLATVEESLGGAGGRRWARDRRGHTFSFDGVEVVATLEDERGKIPLNGLTADEAKGLFQAAGVSGARLSQLTDNLLDWEDGGERPNGTRTLDYAASGMRPRRGPIRTLGELMAIRGMDSDIFDRIAPALTLFPGDTGPFDPSVASPLAIKVMAKVQTQSGEPPSTPSPANTAADYVGQPIAVRITARDGEGGVFQRLTIVELTGQSGQPVWIRAIGDGAQAGDP